MRRRPSSRPSRHSPSSRVAASCSTAATLFEQSALLLIDAIVLDLTGGDSGTYAAMKARHTNLQGRRPQLRGFDVVAFQPESAAVLDDLTARCDRLGVAHSGIEHTPAGPRLDIPDPDGTVLRFYHFTGPIDRFTGIETRDGDYAGKYAVPRLR